MPTVAQMFYKPIVESVGEVNYEFNELLGYLKDSNAAAHSVDNDIFYVVIDLSARSKSYIITFTSLVVSSRGV